MIKKVLPLIVFTIFQILMSVLKILINASKIATTQSAPTRAAAMLAMPSMLMGVAVMTLMSVHWVLTSAPRIATTPLALIIAVVDLGIN